jgi:hypothetical protein
LPNGIDMLEIRRLRVGTKTLSLTFRQIGSEAIAYSDAHFAGAVPIRFTN